MEGRPIIRDLLSLPNHSVRRKVDADATVEVQPGDDPAPIGVRRVDAVPRERHLALEPPPAAACVKRCGGAVGDECDGRRYDDVFGGHVGCVWTIVGSCLPVCYDLLKRKNKSRCSVRKTGNTDPFVLG